MFSTFSKFSANNIDRINRGKSGDGGSDSELDDKIAKLTGHLDKIRNFSDLQRDIDTDEQRKKEKNKSFLSKLLGGDTNKMIFGAMILAFLVIATVGVAASAAGTLAAVAMGVPAVAVGMALAAKAYKKFANRGKSKGNYAPMMSQGIEGMGKLLQKQMSKDLGLEEQQGVKKSRASFFDMLPGSEGEEKIKNLNDEVAHLTKQLAESQETQGIKGLEEKIMEKAKKVLGDDFKGTPSNALFKDDKGNKEEFGTFISKLKNALETHPEKDSDDKATKFLKELVDKCESAGNNTVGEIKPNEKRLVYGALKDIFKDYENKADDQKNALKDAINKGSGGASLDQDKSNEVKALVTEKTKTVNNGMKKAKDDDRKVNDRINKPKAAGK